VEPAAGIERGTLSGGGAADRIGVVAVATRYRQHANAPGGEADGSQGQSGEAAGGQGYVAVGAVGRIIDGEARGPISRVDGQRANLAAVEGERLVDWDVRPGHRRAGRDLDNELSTALAEGDGIVAAAPAAGHQQVTAERIV